MTNPRALPKSPRRFSSPCSLLLYGWGCSKITDAPRLFEGTSTRRAKNPRSARFGPGPASTAWRGSPQPRRPPGPDRALGYIVSNCLPFDESTRTKVVVERDPRTTAARCSERIRIVCNDLTRTPRAFLCLRSRELDARRHSASAITRASPGCQIGAVSGAEFVTLPGLSKFPK